MNSIRSSWKTSLGGLPQLNLSCAIKLGAFGMLLAGAQIPVMADALHDKSDMFVVRKAESGVQKGWVSTIVRFSGTLTLAQEKQLSALSADIYRNLPIINSVALKIPARNLIKLADLPFVQRISGDLQVKKTDAFTSGHSLASTAWAQYPTLDPTHVLVGVVDSGINKVSDVQNVVKSMTWVAGNTNLGDECGHGTHVAGIISGSGKSSTGTGFTQTFRGVGYNANSLKSPLLASLKVLSADGSGRVSDVISAMQWMIKVAKKDPTSGITLPADVRCVLNLSIGHPVAESYTTDPLCQASEQCWQNGIVVICSAGNGGRIQDTVNPSLNNEGYGTAYGSINSPGNDPYVITVGAMKDIDGVRNHDQVSTYSSRGPSRIDFVMKPDIVAPGNKVISVDAGINSGTKAYAWLHQTYPGNIVPTSAYYSGKTPPTPAYYKLSGTSMAAPVVSGAVAMMLAKDMSLSPDTIKARLMLSADKWGFANGSADPCTFGAGYLNVASALNSSIVAPQSVLSPTVNQDTQGNVFININNAIWGTDLTGNHAIWGVAGLKDLHAIWGINAIWGTDSINDQNAIWGINAIWGLNVLTASNAIWGTTVWSNNAIWGVDTFQADFSSHVINGD